jgi:hypothetical protein
MPRLTDPDILALFRQVLDNWYVTDYVTIKDTPFTWAGRNLSGFTVKALARLMYDHFHAGEEIDQVRETRPEWNDRPYHYDFRLAWCGRRLYIETVLVDDDPTDPTIHIVSIHDA